MYHYCALRVQMMPKVFTHEPSIRGSTNTRKHLVINVRSRQRETRSGILVEIKMRLLLGDEQKG